MKVVKSILPAMMAAVALACSQEDSSPGARPSSGAGGASGAFSGPSGGTDESGGNAGYGAVAAAGTSGTGGTLGEAGRSNGGNGGIDTSNGVAGIPASSGSEGAGAAGSAGLNNRSLNANGGSSRDGAAGDGNATLPLQEWTGWLIDADCVGSNPATHTQNCNLMASCIASGFGIYVYSAEKPYDTYGASDWLPFDAAGQSPARQLDWILSDPNDIERHLSKYPNQIPTIKVTGQLVTSGLPSLAEYGDWTTGIHIVSIQFGYIGGVSNYEVTSPENVVLYEAVSP